jgi:hypothetical protein
MPAGKAEAREIMKDLRSIGIELTDPRRSRNGEAIVQLATRQSRDDTQENLFALR